MILAAIAILEVLFWVFLFGGLLIRYTLGWRKVSAALLILTPFTDFLQLILALFDVMNGGYPTFLHGMAAFYIGFSIAGGQQVVHAMDARFAGRFGKAPKPKAKKKPKTPAQKLAEARKDWQRCAMAGAVALAMLFTLMWAAGYSKSFWLIYWIIVVVFTVGAWYFIGPWRLKRKLERADSR